MKYHLLGRSGLKVSMLSFGTATFGGIGNFHYLGNTQLTEAKRLVALCMSAGINLFDTADFYSNGLAEEILGAAIGKENRSHVLISTKASLRMGEGPNKIGSSRLHLIRACEDSLRRLNTEYIDIYHLHNFDSLTPLDETLHALDFLIQQGKIRYIACSNFAAWQVMKSLSISDQKGYQRFISQQCYYSLLARELENELIPVGNDQGVGTMVWSPLAGGLLTGKYDRNSEKPNESRLNNIDPPGTVNWDHLYDIIDALKKIASERQVSITQVSLNWLLHRPGISSVVIGARNEFQLEENLKSVTWKLTEKEMTILNEVSKVPVIYPYWHQQKWASERNPA